MVSYGTCSLFQAYQLDMQMLKTPALRNDLPPPPEVVGQEEVNEFVSVDTFVAVAAPKSMDTVCVVDPFWIIKVTNDN